MKSLKLSRTANFFLVLAMMLTTNVFAKMNGVTRDIYTLDVYKTNSITAEEVDRKYQKEITQIAKYLIALNAMPNMQSAIDLKGPLNVVMDGVRKSGDFSYVGMTPVVYPGGKKIGISIDVVDKSDAKRLQGMTMAPVGSYSDPNGLLASWGAYEEYGRNHLFNATMKAMLEDCPAYHCLFGFNDPAVKKYAVLFNTEVPKYKNELVTILRNDKDEMKRGTAAFLLAHLKDGNEVISILTPSMRDPSSGVRNNVMRVLLEAVTKVNDLDFPVEEAVHALSYPTTTDRNKDLYLLGSLAEKPRYRQYIKDHACHALLEQYHLVQLNLHSGAYSALKNISGKDYAMDDVAAWESWVAKNCPAPDMV